MTILPSSFTGERGLNGRASIRLNKATAPAPTENSRSLLEAFIRMQNDLEAYKSGKPVDVDGHTLTIASVVAAARYASPVTLDASPDIRFRVDASQSAIESKLEAGNSVYGLSTGFGGSADTRTEHALVLGKSLLQHQHVGVLPSSETPLNVLPLSDPLASSSMPESWVRAAILIRMNSLIRGHSGVRWKFIEALGALLKENIIPVVPLRGSISASGDLSPLSYVAGTLIGNPGIRVFDGPSVFGARKMVPAPVAFREHGLEHVVFEAKEHLGLLNGTAFSAGVATLALNDAAHVAMLAQVCTAMGTEALLGTQGSHVPFIHDVARPHAGQIEAAKAIHDLLEGSSFAETGEEKELSLKEDTGKLRQDRYALRTAPQFMGPQLEDILSALAAVTQECNSTTDNPLVDGKTGNVHHGGNFQAMAVTNPMERTRLSLHHFGKLLFAQMTELLNPAFNRGLPPSLAASDPSVNYFAKGLDIAAAAYVSELGHLANPVSTHIQSAEMHNQSINSLALISARATINSLEVLTMLVSSYLYVLCQALDLRALQSEFDIGLQEILIDEVQAHFGAHLGRSSLQSLVAVLIGSIRDALEKSTTQDATPRLQYVAAACTTPLVDYFIIQNPTTSATNNSTTTVNGHAQEETKMTMLQSIATFRTAFAERASTLLQKLQHEFLSGERGPAPASSYLGRTRPVYEFVRTTLGIKMHGWQNLNSFDDGFGDITVGGNVSLIYESIRDGKMQGVVVGLFQ